MSFLQKMGSDGLVPERLASNWQVGSEVGYYHHWTGAKLFGEVVKASAEQIIIQSNLRRYQYEVVRHGA